jgi:hypothetical protein
MTLRVNVSKFYNTKTELTRSEPIKSFLSGHFMTRDHKTTGHTEIHFMAGDVTFGNLRQKLGHLISALIEKILSSYMSLSNG